MNVGRFVLFVIIFAAGFAVHMFFFSDVLPNALFPVQPSTVKTSGSGAAIPTPEFGKSSVYIEYKNGTFSPKTAVSKVNNHILIRNMDSTDAMWLDSTAEFLRTSRPYGLSEQVDVIPSKAGTYTVSNKLKDNVFFTVIVKP
ncbi:hypothetical protein HYS00_03520 [Candidatus Microgenomates bacterium]|nr:hypothetical protein [Candidatus Microgenomates bacterium]